MIKFGYGVRHNWYLRIGLSKNLATKYKQAKNKDSNHFEKLKK